MSFICVTENALIRGNDLEEQKKCKFTQKSGYKTYLMKKIFNEDVRVLASLDIHGASSVTVTYNLHYINFIN